MAATAEIHTATNSAELRAALRELNFTARKDRDDDLRESRFSIRHPQDARVELVVIIDVKNVFDKDGAYECVHVFTMFNDLYPLNVPNHPLNIVVGLPQVHDREIFSNIIRGIAERFATVEVDAAVTERYRPLW